MTFTCPHCGGKLTKAQLSQDRREIPWRVRVRLYGPHDEKVPEADSDLELSPEKPGLTVVEGLPGVAAHVRALAASWHGGAALTGLNDETLKHSLKSLRPTISRRGGDAVWRVRYQVGTNDGVQGWLARVDVQRENQNAV